MRGKARHRLGSEDVWFRLRVVRLPGDLWRRRPRGASLKVVPSSGSRHVNDKCGFAWEPLCLELGNVRPALVLARATVQGGVLFNLAVRSTFFYLWEELQKCGGGWKGRKELHRNEEARAFPETLPLQGPLSRTETNLSPPHRKNRIQTGRDPQQLLSLPLCFKIHRTVAKHVGPVRVAASKEIIGALTGWKEVIIVPLTEQKGTIAGKSASTKTEDVGYHHL